MWSKYHTWSKYHMWRKYHMWSMYVEYMICGQWAGWNKKRGAQERNKGQKKFLNKKRQISARGIRPPSYFRACFRARRHILGHVLGRACHISGQLCPPRHQVLPAGGRTPPLHQAYIQLGDRDVCGAVRMLCSAERSVSPNHS